MTSMLALQQAPLSLDDVEEAEEIILWGFRRWVAGLRTNAPHLWSQVWNDFALRFGPRDGKEALTGLAGCIKAMQAGAWRTITHHAPCCRYVAPDEIRFLAFIGACQRGDWRLSSERAESFVQPDGVGDLLQAGALLGAVMARHGLIARDRLGPKN